MTSNAPPLRWYEPSAPSVAGALVLHDDCGSPDAVDPIARSLAGEGLWVAVPDLLARWAGDAERACDGHAMLDVEAAREALAVRAERIYVVGLGRGGTWALMAAAAVCGFAGVVAFQPRVAYPSLCEQRPTQPLDLLPGVRCPIQVHFAERDEQAPPHHVEAFRERLERLSGAGQLFVYPGAARGFLDPADAAFDGPSARMALVRTRRFLERLGQGS